MKDLQIDTSEEKAVAGWFYQVSWHETRCFAETVCLPLRKVHANVSDFNGTVGRH